MAVTFDVLEAGCLDLPIGVLYLGTRRESRDREDSEMGVDEA